MPTGAGGGGKGRPSSPEKKNNKCGYVQGYDSSLCAKERIYVHARDMGSSVCDAVPAWQNQGH